MTTQAKPLSQTRSAEASRSILRDYALGWVLLALFLASWAFHYYAGWQAFVAEAREHGESAVLWGQEGYIWEFLSTTFENWQSEFLQLLAFVVLTSFLVFKGSPESKSSDEETQKALEEIKAQLTALQRSLNTNR